MSKKDRGPGPSAEEAPEEHADTWIGRHRAGGLRRPYRELVASEPTGRVVRGEGETPLEK